MKYLEKTFNFYPGVVRKRRWPWDKSDDAERRHLASKPHEYMNTGAMCGVCCLAKEAAIHIKEDSHADTSNS